jgi:hypothetical protein
MEQYEGDEEPTHALPKTLQNKLVEAKAWYDKRVQLPQRDVVIEDVEASDAEAASLLWDIVVIVEDAWGFA